MPKLGVWVIGAAGNVGTGAVAGCAALSRGALPPVGVLTETSPFNTLPLCSLEDVAWGGHEVRGRSVDDTLAGLVAESALPTTIVETVAEDVARYQRSIQPAIAAGDPENFQRVREDLRRFKQDNDLDRVVVLNVATTEPPLSVPLPDTVSRLIEALSARNEFPASVVYAAAALDLGFGYVNFTPSPGSTNPVLRQLARERGAVHAGCDGKTGETLVKTALAPMFDVRRLLVQSWFSQNVLGNCDGAALSEDTRRASKVASKSAVLGHVLGYQPESHVGIDYMKSFGDWKVAWNHIQFQGFGGASMTMEFTWRGSDTALAVPLCLDLIRFTELAQRRGEVGVLRYLSMFFKAPLGSNEHCLQAQYAALVKHLDLGGES